MKSLLTHNNDRYLRVILAILTLIIFHIKFGIQIVFPWKHGWLMTQASDWTPDFQAWEYFRLNDWSFPLGLFNGYSWPETISIGLTGGIPLFAVPFKVLDPILPMHFQYFGLWMLFCYMAQTYFAYFILKTFKVKDPVQLFVGTLLLLLSSVLMARTGHLNLCAHWILLGGIWIYYKEASKLWKLIAVCVFSAMTVWIHPYLVLFALALIGAIFLKETLTQRIKWYEFILYTALAIGSILLAWYAIGNFALSFDNKESIGFGYFSANINTFWNSGGYSALMPDAGYATDGQYEGNAYLGLGGLLLIPFILLSFRQWFGSLKGLLLHAPIWLSAIALLIFSFSNVISFNGQILGDYVLPEKWMEYASAFRASGRYVWLAYYMILLFGFLSLIQYKPIRKWLNIILLLLLAIQIIDLSPLIKRDSYISHKPYESLIQKEHWQLAFGETEMVRMYPPHDRKIHEAYDNTYFIELAYENQIPINSGHLARFNENGRELERKILEQRLAEADIDVNSKEIFICSSYDLNKFERVVNAGNTFAYKMDNYFLFVPKGMKATNTRLQNAGKKTTQSFNYEDFSQFVPKYKDDIWLISVRDEAQYHLNHCDSFVEFMLESGSNINDFKFRDSYIAAVVKGALIYEKFEPIPLEHDIGIDLFKPYGTDSIVSISLKSAGLDHGDKSSIMVNGIEKSTNKRGLNIVILGSDGKVKFSTFFDTFQECFHRTETDNIFEVWFID